MLTYKMPGRRIMELQACQSELGPGEALGADYLDFHHTMLPEQPGDQAQSAWVCQRQVLIGKSDLRA